MKKPICPKCKKWETFREGMLCDLCREEEHQIQTETNTPKVCSCGRNVSYTVTGIRSQLVCDGCIKPHQNCSCEKIVKEGV